MINRIELPAKLERDWDEVLSAINFVCPAFTHLMYSLLDNHNGSPAIWTRDIPMAATDGNAMLINPDNYFSKEMKTKHRLFVAAHEILHNALEHIFLSHGFRTRGSIMFKDGASLPYDHGLMNKAMDYVVNATLIEGNIGEMPPAPFTGLHDPSIATGDSDFLEVYRKLYKQQGGAGKGKGKGGASQPGDNPQGNDHGGGFCEHHAPGESRGQDSQSAAAAHSPGKVQSAVAAAINAARTMGNLPASLERLLGKVLEPKVDWREHVRSLIMRKAGSGGYDFQRADDELIIRDIYAPRRSGFGAGCIVCAIDTSGSITQADYDLFYGEVSGVLEDVKPAQLVVIWCDMAINRVEEVDDASELRTFKVKAGGGTSFIPVFDKIEDMGLRPDALIYLTDGEGCFPSQSPSYPVIWGSILESSKYPFGEVVQVPHKK